MTQEKIASNVSTRFYGRGILKGILVVHDNRNRSGLSGSGIASENAYSASAPASDDDLNALRSGEFTPWKVGFYRPSSGAPVSSAVAVSAGSSASGITSAGSIGFSSACRSLRSPGSAHSVIGHSPGSAASGVGRNVAIESGNRSERSARGRSALTVTASSSSAAGSFYRYDD
jgi:hypothetical protein